MKKVRIEGMTCSGCSGRVEKAMKGVAGIENVNVDLRDNSATFDGPVTDQQVKEAIEDIGYDVTGFEN